MQMTYDMYAIPHSIRSSIDAALLPRCTSKNDGASTRHDMDKINAWTQRRVQEWIETE